MKRLGFVLILTVLCAVGEMSAQSIELAKGEVKSITSDLTNLDLLVMNDNSVLKFEGAKNFVLRCRYVIVGKNCGFVGKGADGLAAAENASTKERSAPGMDGADGYEGLSGHAGEPGINLQIHFDELASIGSLVVDLRGGNGGKGGKGGKGGSGGNGQLAIAGQASIEPRNGGRGGQGGRGGEGGNGGSLLLSIGNGESLKISLTSKPDKKGDKLIKYLLSGGSAGEKGDGGDGGDGGDAKDINQRQGAVGRIGEPGGTFNVAAEDGLFEYDTSPNETCFENAKTNIKAILIAVSYVNGVNSPEFVENAKALFRVLKDKYIFEEIDTVFNGTKERIDSTFQQLGELNSDSKVVVFLSGHGILKGNSAYFKTSDGLNWNFSYILDYVERAKCSKILCIVNSCHSGGIAGENEKRALAFDYVTYPLKPEDVCLKPAKTIIVSTHKTDTITLNEFPKALMSMLNEREGKNDDEIGRRFTAGQIYQKIIDYSLVKTGIPQIIKFATYQWGDFIFFKK